MTRFSTTLCAVAFVGTAFIGGCSSRAASGAGSATDRREPAADARQPSTDARGPAAEAHAPATGALAPAALFESVERHLLEANALRLSFAITAKGAFQADLRGTLSITDHSAVELHAAGTFGDAPVDLHLRSDGQTMEGGNADRTFRGDAPAELVDALVLGLMRMGILHNLARLTAGAPPDHADGGVREWVQVHAVRFDEGAARPRADALGLSFAINVNGQRAAEATLWADPTAMLPLQRSQVVSFPGGTMTVTEIYEALES